MGTDTTLHLVPTDTFSTCPDLDMLCIPSDPGGPRPAEPDAGVIAFRSSSLRLPELLLRTPCAWARIWALLPAVLSPRLIVFGAYYFGWETSLCQPSNSVVPGSVESSRLHGAALFKTILTCCGLH